MFVIYGTKVFEKKLGRSKTMIRCEHCHNEAFWSYLRMRRWVTLYYIPIFPVRSHNVFRCPACNYGIEVTQYNENRIMPLIDLIEK